jgi:hypothetical protein
VEKVSFGKNKDAFNITKCLYFYLDNIIELALTTHFAFFKNKKSSPKTLLWETLPK